MRIRYFAALCLALFVGWPVLSGGLVSMMDGWASYTVQFTASKVLLALSICLLGTLFGVWKEVGFVPPRGLRGWLSSIPLWVVILLMFVSAGSFGAPGLVQMIMVFIPLALATSYSEEVLFRGGIWAALRPFGLWPVVLLTSIGFGAAHLQGLAVDIPDILIYAQAFMAFSVGLVFAAMRVASGSIWAPVAGHAIFNWLSSSINGFGESAGPMPTDIPPEQVAASLAVVSLGIAIAGAVACWLAIRAERKTDLPQEASPAPA